MPEHGSLEVEHRNPFFDHGGTVELVGIEPAMYRIVLVVLIGDRKRLYLTPEHV